MSLQVLLGNGTQKWKGDKSDAYKSTTDKGDNWVHNSPFNDYKYILLVVFSFNSA